MEVRPGGRHEKMLQWDAYHDAEVVAPNGAFRKGDEKIENHAAVHLYRDGSSDDVFDQRRRHHEVGDILRVGFLSGETSLLTTDS